MHVVATAGHVDHGKSTLVRALTGMEPDRLTEERRRGLTIELGYVWTELDGHTLAFVDVPGHERFIATMLAGLGPAPAVLFVVAADEGWCQQSEEHLAAIDALDLRHAVLAVTRSDLADPAPALEHAGNRLKASSLGEVRAVAVSGRTGHGLQSLRDALRELTRQLPAPDIDGPVRLWIDRSFTVRGAGTVVTGTLGAGTIRVGDEFVLNGRRVGVRGLHQTGQKRQEVTAVGRVAVNLRDVDRSHAARGDALLSKDAAGTSTEIDVRLHEVLVTPLDPARLPGQVMLHLGSAAVAARPRALAGDTVRLRLDTALPVRAADRAVLRDPGAHRVIAGVEVLEIDPPPLRRRGAAARRGRQLAQPGAVASPAEQEAEQHLRLTRQLTEAVDRLATRRPLDPGVPRPELVRLLGLPDPTRLDALIVSADLHTEGGRVYRAGHRPSLGAHEDALQQLEARLVERPFTAPEQPELDALGLGRRQLAVAVATGRLLHLAPGVFLRPDAPAQAMRVLAGLGQPFTTSAARIALATTRRVAVPLLEDLDGRGWTRRLDTGNRVVVR